MTDLERAALRVAACITNKGSHPGYHDKKLLALRDEWPTLYNRLIDLVSLTKAPEFP